MTALRCAAAAILAFACVTTLGCQSPEESFREHVARAEVFAEEGRRREAILEYTTALGIDRTNAEIHERLGHLTARSGDIESSIRYFREAYNLDRNRISAAMSEVQLIAGHSRKRARELVAEGLERFPESPVVHRTVAEMALIDGDVEAAKAAARRAAQLGPEESANWIQLGRVYQAEIRKAQLSEEVADGDIFEEALAAFDRADSLEEGDVGVRIERARVYKSWPGHREQSLAELESALSLAKQSGERDLHGHVAKVVQRFAQQTGDAALEERALRELVAAIPIDYDAWQALANLAAQRGGSPDDVYAEMLAARPEDPRAHRRFVSALVKRERRREALTHIENTLEAGVESPLLMDDLIRIRLQNGQVVEAQAALERLKEMDAEGPITRRAEARLELAAGRNSRAVRLLHTLAGPDETVEGQRLLATAEHRRGHYDEAITAIDRSIALAQTPSATSLRLKGRIHHDAGDWAQCLRVFRGLSESGVVLRPSEQLMTARALYQRGQSAAGRALLDEILASSAPTPHAAVEFARREGADHPKLARLHLANAWRESPNFAVLESLVALELEEGRPDAALERVNQALAGEHGGARALLLRARLLRDTGELRRAETDALRAFEAAPGLPGAIDLLLSIYAANGSSEAAIRSFEEAEAAGMLHVGARVLLARLQIEAGQRDRARELLESVLEDHPRSLMANSELSMLLASDGGDLERSLELAKNVASSNPRTSEAHHAIGYAYLRSGRHEAALEELRTAIDLDPSADGRRSAELRYHLGLTLQALERNDQAEAAFAAAKSIDPNATAVQ